MRHRPSSSVLPLALLVLGACGEKSAPSGAAVSAEPPAATASATAGGVAQTAPSATAEAPAPSVAKGPKFVVRGATTSGAILAWVGSGVVICPTSDCLGDANLITEKGVTDTYDPRGQIQLQFGYMFKKELNGVQLRYRGDYPEICATYSYWNDRSDFGGVTMKRTGKSWEAGECSYTSHEDPKVSRPPRALDDALLHAPIPDAAQTMIHGAGAPPMLVAEQALYVWDGKTWAKRDAPWKLKTSDNSFQELSMSRRPVRLADGTTLVPQGGYLVDSQGGVSAFELVREDKPLAPETAVTGVVWAKKGLWLVATQKYDIFFLTAESPDKNRFSRADPPKREGAPRGKPQASAKPTAAPSAAPSASAAIAPGASVAVSATASASAAPTASATAAASSTGVAPTASASADPALASASPTSSVAPADTASPAASTDPTALTAPKNYTPACTTPFVLLATPPKPGQAYATTRDGLRGSTELQDLVTFIEFVVEGKTYFGAQVKTEADARTFMAAVEKGVKGMKPQLTCLDVLSRIPDRYAPPDGMRIVGINLTTGELVPFD